MKLRNKKTGEIKDVNLKSIEYPNTPQGYPEYKLYTSLAELNAEWCDAEDWEDTPEEPKKYWYMTAWGDVYEYSQSQFAIKQKQAIGNYFESEEEAEKAVEKLKAWKRLKDKGFKFQGWDFNIADDWSCNGKIKYRAGDFTKAEIKPDLDLLFGGEE